LNIFFHPGKKIYIRARMDVDVDLHPRFGWRFFFHPRCGWTRGGAAHFHPAIIQFCKTLVDDMIED
jgi:hypothetical protein